MKLNGFYGTVSTTGRDGFPCLSGLWQWEFLLRFIRDAEVTSEQLADVVGHRDSAACGFSFGEPGERARLPRVQLSSVAFAAHSA